MIRRNVRRVFRGDVEAVQSKNANPANTAARTSPSPYVWPKLIIDTLAPLVLLLPAAVAVAEPSPKPVLTALPLPVVEAPVELGFEPEVVEDMVVMVDELALVGF